MPVTLGVVLSAAQMGKGVYDTIKSGSERKRALKSFQENPYLVPKSQIQATNKAATLAQGTKMAGQDVMETNIGARTGEGIGAVKRAAQSPSQVLASTIDLYRNQQAQQEQLDLTSANDYRTRQQGYVNALTSLSPYLDMQYKNNVLAPIQAKLNYAGGLEASGQQNISQGISSGLNVYANQQYINGLNTAPTNGMQSGTTINPIGVSQLPSQQANQGLMPMNYRAPYWGNGVPDNSIQQRQGNY
jgi:hypothetical protein